MKILFLAHRIPYPPNKGEKIRAYHEIKFLAARHEIDLFCFARSQAEAAEGKGLLPLCRHLHIETLGRASSMLQAARGFARNEPFSIGHFASSRLAAAVGRALAEQEYDLIFVFSSSMAQYVPQPSPAPVVIDFVDADSAKWAQYARHSRFPFSWVYRRESRLLAGYERRMVRAFEASVAATAQEAAELQEDSSRPIEVIGNGTDFTSHARPAELPEEIRRCRPYVLFVGTMDYLPNVDAVVGFVEEILPRVRAVHPDLKFVIVGRDPAYRVRRLARRPGVIVTGEVPCVNAYLWGAEAVVAPFRICQGVQNKILEAMACGKPVIATSRPALAVRARHQETLLVADTPEEFARAVIAVLGDPELRSRLSQATGFVRKHFNWQNHLSRLESLLERVASGSPAGAPEEKNRVQAG